MEALAKWSIKNYHQMIEAGILQDRQVELLAGEIIEMSPEGAPHYMLGENTANYLKELLQNQAYVRFDGPITLANSEPEPDIAVVHLPRETYLQRHPYPEDVLLIIEISYSTLETDLGKKKTIYANNQIQEYWVIDMKQKNLIIFREPDQGDYIVRKEIKQGNVTLLAFPEITVSVNRLINA
ncbi:Uma2 family endonuclease [Crocosphaera sp. UHCC 0190]|uniref:Uma2 family endonuclease n=1 Tax=Crocosphaera sp. UHCC 0190 TaxID=3110246 RepID=UPI002B1EF989|nr:Uma2 family endonuclease [Crocosphaera sp. UHCC 0190]MEA5511635.1 Uma2 family endonuclease [Crocosphaera sp. UHCC 0190]